MAKCVQDSLWFPEKLGKRLVRLRKKQRLTQRQVAESVGLTGKGSKTYICRLERGRFRSPSLRLIGDYLRACGAGFEHVLDVLHEYTSRPSVPDEQGWVHVRQAIQGLSPGLAGQVIKYDFKTTQARRRAAKLPESPELRVKHDLNWARKQAWLRQLRARVVQVINEHGLDVGGVVNEILLRGHARKVWGILGRTRGKPAGRGRLLSEAEDWFARQGVVGSEVVRVVDKAVVALYDEADESGGIAGLDPARPYTAAILLARPPDSDTTRISFHADGQRMLDNVLLQFTPTLRVMTLPPELYRDSSLEFTVSRVHGARAFLADVYLWDHPLRGGGQQTGGSRTVAPAELTALPNPARTSVTVRLSRPLNDCEQALVFDSQGRLVRSLSGSGRVFTWDGCDGNGVEAASGAYFVEVAGGRCRVLLLR